MTRFLLFSMMFLAGCATSPYKVDYLVSPPGGQLFVKTANGTRPFNNFDSLTGKARAYFGSKNPERYTDENGCYQTAEIIAYWVSGASVSVKPKLCNGPGVYSYTLMRPSGEGRQQDVDYGLLLAKQAQDRAVLKEAKRKAQQEEKDRQTNAFLKAVSGNSNNNRVQTNCTSRVVGNQVYTSCN